jgi:hypothetical protein
MTVHGAATRTHATGIDAARLRPTSDRYEEKNDLPVPRSPAFTEGRRVHRLVFSDIRKLEPTGSTRGVGTNGILNV